MKVLVVGQGGREHAIVQSLSCSSHVTEIHVAPGSHGIGRQALCHPIDASSTSQIVNLVKINEIDLVVIGPENPLINGLSDVLRGEGIAVFGPSRSASQLEGSKCFAKRFMVEHQIPTAPAIEVDSVETTLRESQNFSSPWVLKADGLAAGKGVVICRTIEELKEAAHSFFEKKVFGASSARALLEKFMVGWEMSCHILTNGENYEVLPVAQDHKRIYDDDRGPNTGGMGSVAPVPIAPGLDQALRSQILDPLMRGLKKNEFDYRGVLYVGLMITPEGPRVIEFNVRFGDPEAQVLLPLLDGDWGSVFHSIALGRVPALKWKNLHATCVVLASQGYPDSPIFGSAVQGDPMMELPSSYFLHAGLKCEEQSWSVVGGRVINSIGLGSSRGEALKNAYRHISNVSWSGMQYRKDIGKNTPG